MKTLILYVIWFFSSVSWAASGITYHGRILRPDNTPVVSPTTEFRIQLKSPGDEGCLFWEEFQTKNLSQTSGVFTITIGDTDSPGRVHVNVTNPLTASPFTLLQVFSNKNSYPSGLTCDDASGTYTPATSHGRKLQVYFREGPGFSWETLPAAAINFVPLAYNSTQLDGYRSNEFLKIDPLAVYTPLTVGQVNTLMDIIAGTNTQYLRPTTTFGGDVSGTYNAISVNRIRGTNVVSTAPTSGQVLKFDGTNWVPSADDTGGAPGDASYAAKGIIQVDTNLAVSGLTITGGVLSMPNIGTAGTFGSASLVPVITTDAKGRITSIVNTTVDDTSKLPLAGGTMSGSINMGLQNITNATSVAATNFSGRNLILNDNDTNTVTVITPGDISADYVLELPANDGGAGEVLTSNGSGVLSWTTPASGISVTANQAVIANGAGTGLTSFACPINQAFSFDGAGLPTCQAVTPAGGFINGGNSFGAAATIGTNDNYALNIETNGTTKMTVLANGNVGIGEPSPAHDLDIIGDTIRLQAGNSNKASFIEASNPSGGRLVIRTTNNGDNASFALENGVGATWTFNGNERMRILESGHVGIGTSTPQAQLDIAIPSSNTTTNAELILSTHDGTYRQPAIYLLGTRPSFTSKFGDTGVEGWKIASVSGSGGNGGMEDDLALCSRSGTAPERCSLHVDSGNGNMNLGGTNSSVHMGSKVNVQGNMTVGTTWSTYSTQQAAPANSLIVENMIGAGTATPATALDVNGAISTRGMAAPAVSPAGQGRIYFDSISNKFRVSQNGGAYVDLIPSGGVGDVLNNGNSFGVAATIGTNDNFNLNFETNSTTHMTITNSGNFILGPNSGMASRFAMTTNSVGLSDDDIVNFSASNTSVNHPSSVMFRSRGTIAAPTAVQSGDLLGGFYAAGFNGSIPVVSAGVVSYAQSNFDSSISGSLRLFTVNGANDNSKLFISPIGHVAIGDGVLDPSSILDINGALTQRGMSAPAVSPAGQGRIYYDSISNKFRVSQNGGAYADLIPNGGAVGGTGTVNAVPKFTAAGTIGDSAIVDNGTTITATRSIASATNPIASGASINLATSNTHTLASVGGSVITISNPSNGGVYNIVIEDTTSRMYTFSGCTTTYFKPANAATEAGTRSIYGLMTVQKGANWDCYVTWSTGFQ